jgi:hypothetical protein
MYLAVVNTTTNIVENCIVPPQGANVWFVPEGYDAIETTTGAIGDTWNGTEFIKPIAGGE